MLKKVEAFIRQYNMIESGDHVVIGVSGGADSVCLLDVLDKLSKKLCFSVTVVHINHMIRGAEADSDENYVKELCGRYGYPLVSHRIDVPKLSKENGWSEEEAGRRVRYECFEGVEGMTKIAVAHHGDDQAETVIHNILRGSSIKGAGGMSPVTGKVIRPLLCARRVEIEDYLSKEGLEFCQDSTNLSEEYTRNRIRRCIASDFVQINANAVDNINAFAGDLKECYFYIEEQAKKIYNQCLKNISYSEIVLDADILMREKEIIRRTVIVMAIEQIAQSLKDIARVHIEAVDGLLFNNVSKKANLPYGICAIRGYNIIKMSNQNCEVSRGEVENAPNLAVETEEFDGDWEKLTNDYTKVFDCDKIKGNVILRRRMPGDYLVIDDMGKKKSLNRYFIDSKVPKEQRDKVWLVAEDSHVLWVVGYRTSAACMTDERTTKVLKVTVRRNRDEIQL